MLPDLSPRHRCYILDGHMPCVAESLTAWAQWFRDHPRDGIVASTSVGDFVVTTMFTGLDRSLYDHEPPTLFQTTSIDCVMADVHVCGTAATWADAVECHRAAVASMERLTEHSPPATQEPL